MAKKELERVFASLSQDEKDTVESIIIQGNSIRAIIKSGLVRLQRFGLIHSVDGKSIFTYCGGPISQWFELTAI